MPLFSISSRIIKKNADISIDIPHSSFNNSIYQSEFPSVLKLANITPAFKKGDRNSKENYRQSAYFQTSQKSLNDACLVKFPVLWIPIYQSNTVGLEKVTAHSTACW